MPLPECATTNECNSPSTHTLVHPPTHSHTYVCTSSAVVIPFECHVPCSTYNSCMRSKNFCLHLTRLRQFVLCSVRYLCAHMYAYVYPYTYVYIHMCVFFCTACWIRSGANRIWHQLLLRTLRPRRKQKQNQTEHELELDYVVP